MKPILVSLVAFLLIFIGLRHMVPGGFLLYQGIAVGVAVALGQLFFQRGRRASLLQAFKDSALTFLLIYAFVFTIPTTVDRSYSVRMLNRLAASSAGLSTEEIGRSYSQYFSEGGGVEKRLREQIATGTIREKDERFVLTPVGRFLSWTFRGTETIFACGDAR